MSERLKTLHRIVKLRAQMAQAAEWSLAAGERKLAATEADRLALDTFVNDGLASGGLEAMALRQTQALAVKHERLSQERTALAAEALDARRLHKQAETVTADAAALDRGHRERRELERIIEALAGREPHSH